MIDYKNLKVGDSITIQGAAGTIVYIHPEKRFFRVEFANERGDVFHECFRMHPSEKVLKDDLSQIRTEEEKDP